VRELNNHYMNTRSLIQASLRESIGVHQALVKTAPAQVERAARWVAGALARGNKLLFFGNGGFAAHAQHIAAEFVGRFEREREGYAAIALTADTALLTALVNDYPPEFLFSRQVKALGRKGDVVLAFSASGTSPNVIEGLRAARALGLTCLGFCGERGDKMAPLCDLCFQAPSKRTARIQEVHLTLCHALCEAADALLAAKTKLSALPVAKLDETPWPKRLALIVWDFDGVMTDNGVLVGQDARETVRCDRSDGWGIGLLRKAGVPMIVISTEDNPVVAARCVKLKIPCHHGVKDKAEYLKHYLKGQRIKSAETVFVGNDHNDLGALKVVGFPVVVGDAHPSVLPPVAKLVLKHSGGHGAVREFCDMILKRMEAGKLKIG